MNTMNTEKETVVAIDESKLYVEINPDKNVLMYQWKGHILDEETREGFLRILNLIKKHQIVNLIADISQFKGGSIKTAKWVDEQWSEMLKGNGVEKIAIVVPESAFGEFSNSVALGQKFVSLLEVEKFTSSAEAYAWFEK
ncbi:STAS/SEC14 domain-containing protein [Tunicatimonas pelagia]|uniref:STAS/SEC14 domain-containing protein n=1 Tax=Tunicatimonas pelagia TaxID=931531 RepID=UPI00266576F2|nr:STAS/SEC14 domain-containing protein [Tunicatimonas pelagia]WKN45721.1 STAS/SEC14 domain-containing protein [Tunicatimonas pelagia]